MSNAKDITSKLWEMANKLRGTMDASEYKNYILPFMFYRYLSENQDEYLKVNGLEDFYEVTDEDEKEEYLEEISKGIGYAIDPAYTWNKIVSKIENHKIKASDFQDMFDSFNTNAKRNAVAEADFANVFSDVNLGDTRLGSSTNERAKALNDIVVMINEFNFKDDSGHDILGDVYEYLIGQFAANAGKKGGEFYTPHEVSQILAKIVTVDTHRTGNQFRVYDPTMGSGSLLLTVQKELPYGDEEGSVEFFGQELNTTTYNLARMNLMMHGVNYRNMELKRADTLDADWPFAEKDGTQIPLKFDAVVANPPYSQKWNTKDVDREKDIRFKGYGVAPASKADYAFVLHGLYHLDKAGTMAIVLPHGVLFRGASEGKIRKNIIDNNLLDTVIGLPSNLFYGTSIPTCVLVFKGREARKNKDVLFIDASNEFEKGKNQNKLTPDNINKIIDTYHNREDVEKYSHVASLDEIKENDYNLNIPRYVDTFEEEEVIPLSEVAKELTEVKAEIENSYESLFGLLNELNGTTDEAKDELSKFINLLTK
ncbi:type I restriction-modification system subunit M [Clostridium botulinum C]|uniref:site-specific DNA-methyltransferase (adenine-specific) n=2 Tax=Clostridium botulinum TaxID=1491 RepID=A0A9Q4THI1_CLOBO|nr:type I restriction-modification system subunit M [Clostridium botulinum]MCD3193928.1 type I restriction-modification system subunit M [Clostridium botulinum C]MCD3199443.1 type I restriction-modification system subunit M [Clostridium botulinum C]MCD3204918.1 type I restriction-modification system subunit M [Clostridium botulinum C]MCD3207743.1 type I restriction-modification system subunit M [Clostridium botulinum C]MCD3224799.1 type I restriction-modification system subunit M [Clostridium 